MLLRHAIGHVLRRIRLDRRLTLRDLAARSQVSVPYLSEIERGRKEVSSEILATVCRVLDLSVGDLLTAVSVELGGAETARMAPVITLESRTSLESHAGYGGSGPDSSSFAPSQPLLLAA